MPQALLLIGLLMAITTKAQYKVTVRLGQLPKGHQSDTVWLSGSFNEWNPRPAAHYALPIDGGRGGAVIQLPAGSHEFKCTRGSWDKVECSAEGKDVGNRAITVNGDTSWVLNIAGWKDDFASSVRKSTASAQVRIMTDSFYMPQLNRHRRIWLYLPKGYADSKERYPVLYMHDAQNLFDERTAPFDEWGVDECLDSLPLRCIVVGIDNGSSKRMNEYNPYVFLNIRPPQGDAYVDFLVNTLKPHIDRHYRTLPGTATTGIAGSSMGGVISLYAVLKYPQVFGQAGIFSPALRTAQELDRYIDSLPHAISARLFFYAGGQEGKDMLPDMERITEKLALKSNYFIYSVVEEEGKHYELAWRKWLPAFLTWTYLNRAE